LCFCVFSCFFDDFVPFFGTAWFGRGSAVVRPRFGRGSPWFGCGSATVRPWFGRASAVVWPWFGRGLQDFDVFSRKIWILCKILHTFIDFIRFSCDFVKKGKFLSVFIKMF
jgi:hypothetical protein